MKILRPAQIYQIRLGRPVTPANFGGDSNSDSSTPTTNNVTNTTTSTDKRAVASDSAVSLSGDGNSIDRSSTTSFFDSSNKSTNTLTSFVDSSTKSSDSSINNSGNSSSSTAFTDNSNRSVTTNVVDYGSVNGSLSLAGSMSDKAFGTASLGIQGAIDVLKLQTSEGSKTIMGAFDMAKSSGANSMANSAAVLGFASNAIKQTSDAFATAKDGGQSKMVMAAIGAIAVVGVAFALN